jgi:hypothetical protein
MDSASAPKALLSECGGKSLPPAGREPSQQTSSD